MASFFPRCARRALRKPLAVVAAGATASYLLHVRRTEDYMCPLAYAASVPIGRDGGNQISAPSSASRGFFSSGVKDNDDGLCSLIYNGASIDSLHTALGLNKSSGPSQLLPQQVNQLGAGGASPLHVAAFRGDLAALELLIDSGADTEIGTAAPTRTDLWEAYFPQYRPAAGVTAVEMAVLAGKPEAVSFLIERGQSDPTYVPPTPPKRKPIAGLPPGMQPGNDEAPPKRTLQDCIRFAHAYQSAASQTARESFQKMMTDAIEAGRARREERVRQFRTQFPLESRLSQQLVGQEHAVRVVSSAIRRKENGWVDSDSPLVMLFMGSSGIGKTKTAKLVSDYLFESKDKETKEKCFIRMDMTEFQTKHEVSKFIGSPPGYIGYDQGGQLVNKLEKCPNAVVLLDEVEKAHPDVLTVMLQAFDEGRLTDGQGKTIDCKDAVFVMTSNLAQTQIADEAVNIRNIAKITGGGSASGTSDAASSASSGLLTKSFQRKVVQPILRRHFGRDEFLGRINEIVFFLPFTENEQWTLADKELEIWADRARGKHGIKLEWSKDVAKLAALGYDLRYGARSIKYEIDRLCIGPIARAHEQGFLSPNSKVFVDTVQPFEKIKSATEEREATVEGKKKMSADALKAAETTAKTTSDSTAGKSDAVDLTRAEPSKKVPSDEAPTSEKTRVFREHDIVLYVTPAEGERSKEGGLLSKLWGKK